MLSRAFFAVFVLAFTQLYAQPDPIVVDDDNALIQLRGENTMFFEDTSARLGLDGIHRRFKSGHFKSYDDVPNFTGTPGSVWFMCRVVNRTSENIAILFPNTFLEEIEIFWIDSLQTTSKQAGSLLPFKKRDYAVSDFIVTLSLKASQGTVLIFGRLRAHEQPPMFMLIHLGAASAVLARSRVDEMISMAVLGIMFVMLFYNFCLSLVIKDKLYLYYCVYIITSSVTIMWFNGFLFQWLWPDNPSFNRFPWEMGLFTFGQLLFANKLLGVKSSLPKLYWCTYPLYVASGIVCLGFAVSPETRNIIINTTSFVLSLYFITVSLILSLKRNVIAYIFLIGWSPILVGTVINILMVTGKIPYVTFVDTHGIQLFLAWEVVIFSLGLGYRFNIMRTEKMVIQAENLRIISEQKATLNKLVFEQTEEILTQNDQLIRNQEEIRLQNERLETQNRAYERLKEMILRQNRELEKAVQRRTLELAQSNEQLTRHVHQLEQFSFIAAHNLRAPVARILGLTNILDFANPANPENVGVLRMLIESAKDLDVIIHDLGAVVEAGTNRIEKFEPVHVSALIEKVLMRFNADIEQGGVVVKVLVAAPLIYGIPAYFDSIFANLLSNSIKYRAEDRTPVILIATEETETEVSITVHDNGIGFDSKEFHRKLFEPFQRFHIHKEGKGLGMFLVKTQVSAMDGSISLISEPGVGTHIVINLPKIKSQKRI